MADKLLTMIEASEYVGLPLRFLRSQIMHGQGPAYVIPGARTKFFTKSDLDAWKATWSRSTN